MPTLVFEKTAYGEEVPRLAVGCAGNAWIPVSVYNIITGVIDGKLGAQAAIEAPRFLPGRDPADPLENGERIEIEDRFPRALLQDLIDARPQVPEDRPQGRSALRLCGGDLGRCRGPPGRRRRRAAPLARGGCVRAGDDFAVRSARAPEPPARAATSPQLIRGCRPPCSYNHGMKIILPRRSRSLSPQSSPVACAIGSARRAHQPDRKTAIGSDHHHTGDAGATKQVTDANGTIEHKSEVPRGGPVAAVVRVPGCQHDAAGACKVNADVIVYKPDGSVSTRRKTSTCRPGAVPVPLKFDASAATGVYRVVVTIRDVTARRFATVERQFGVK